MGFLKTVTESMLKEWVHESNLDLDLAFEIFELIPNPTTELKVITGHMHGFNFANYDEVYLLSAEWFEAWK